MCLVTALSQTRSVPGFGRMKTSARWASSCSRRSATTTWCPPSFCARLIRALITGWDCSVLVPTHSTSSARSMSLIEPASPP